MTYSEQGLALTQRFEGLRLSAYQDSAGVWTIGYGHTGADVHPGLRITAAEATDLLRRDLAVAVACVNSLVMVPLTQGQFDALVDFTFNLGQGTLRRSTLLLMVNRRDFVSAAIQFGLWIHVGGRIESGLVSRRTAEAKMFQF